MGFPAYGDRCSFTVAGKEDRPVAVDDVAPYTGFVVIPVLANDRVPAGGGAAITGFASQSEQGGTVARNGTGLSYTPGVKGVVVDRFTYTMMDETRPGLGTSTATVEVRPAATVSITATCRGGDCLFDAAATPSDGVVRYEWTIAGNAKKPGWTREYHRFTAAGTHPVTVRAVYYSGMTAEKTIQQTITFKNEIQWTCVFNGSAPVWNAYNANGTNNCTLAKVQANSSWYLNFQGGLASNEVRVTWSTVASDVLGGGNVSTMYCDEHLGCQAVSAGFSRSGTYRIAVGVYPKGGSTPIVEQFGYVNVGNEAPRPSFTQKLVHPRQYEFDPSTSIDTVGGAELSLTGALRPNPHEWDFGDGEGKTELATLSAIPKPRHVFSKPGEYLVTLKLTDIEGVAGTVTNPITITNAPPTVRVGPHCAGMRCNAGSDPSTDDYGELTNRRWNYGDATSGTSSGSYSYHEYTQPGCYTVTLTASDQDGADGTGRYTVAVSNGRTAPAGVAAVDAHSGSYMSGTVSNSVTKYTSSNLNGIAEPGEAVMFEPGWSMPAGSGWDIYGPELSLPQGVTASLPQPYAVYRSLGGAADCWTWRTNLGPGFAGCHALVLDAKDERVQPHADATIREYTSEGWKTSTVHIGASFTDVPVNAWYYPYVESILHRGITNGCSGRQFCPANAVTRQELAIFLLRGKYGAAFQPPACTGTGPYNDVPCTHWSAAWIARAKADNIMRGYADGTFRPTEAVTRAGIAEPLLRAAAGLTAPPPCTQFFSDVSCDDGDMPAAWIAELKRRGYTSGCTSTTYCPHLTVDRATAAVLLVRGFNAAIDHKVCAPGTPIYTNAAEEVNQ